MQCYRLTRAVTLAASILPPRRHYTPQHLLRARLPAVQHHLAPGGPNSDLVAPSIRRALSAIKGVTASTLKTSFPAERDARRSASRVTSRQEAPERTAPLGTNRRLTQISAGSAWTRAHSAVMFEKNSGFLPAAQGLQMLAGARQNPTSRGRLT